MQCAILFSWWRLILDNVLFVFGGSSVSGETLNDVFVSDLEAIPPSPYYQPYPPYLPVDLY